MTTLEPDHWWSLVRPSLEGLEPQLVVTDAHSGWPALIGAELPAAVHCWFGAGEPVVVLGPDEHFRSVIVIDQLPTLGIGGWSTLLRQVGRTATVGALLLVAENLTGAPRAHREAVVEAILGAGFGGVDVRDAERPECTLITARLRS